MSIIRRRPNKLGIPAGSLLDAKNGELDIEIIDYDSNRLEEKKVDDLTECFKYKKTKTISWINIEGISNSQIIREIGKEFDVHELILEDIMTIGQRPKIEETDNYTFIVLNSIRPDVNKRETEIEQISIILNKNFVITFQEGKKGDTFNPVREMIRKNKGKIRSMGSDYLVYQLIDSIVDEYFNLLEQLGDKIEFLETKMITEPHPRVLNDLNNVKREVLTLRKSIWPLREVINTIQRSESKLMSKTTKVYFRDIYDHTVEIIDNVETIRDIMAGMTDVFLSSQSNKMNSVMKVLTIITTIFMPLSFLTGIYGMNFDYMPGIHSHYGFFAIWIVTIIIVLVMVLWFRRKEWI